MDDRTESRGGSKTTNTASSLQRIGRCVEQLSPIFRRDMVHKRIEKRDYLLTFTPLVSLSILVMEKKNSFLFLPCILFNFFMTNFNYLF